MELLTHDEWHRLRDVRLSALNESPGKFLSTYDRELAYREQEWRTELSRGEWTVAVGEGRPVGLLGATQEPDTPVNERYLEYLWVSPECRQVGVASRLLRTVLERLQDYGVATVWLWILDGNGQALRLYERFGFVSTRERHLLTADPVRSEERMKLRLR